MKLSRKILGVMLVMLLVMSFAQASMATELSIITRSLSQATAGEYYEEQLMTNYSSSSSVVWAIIGKPSWLNINTGNGTIYGTPESAGSYSFLVSAAADSYMVAVKYTLTVNESTIEFDIVTEYLSNGTVDEPYADAVVANKTGITWSHTWKDNKKPADDFDFDDATATVKGTPKTEGSYTLNVTASVANSSGVPTTKEKSFPFTIYPKTVEPIDILSNILGSAIQDEKYTAELLSNKTNATWSMPYPEQRLPSDLNVTLNSDGTITGAPKYSGTFDFVVRAYDSASNTEAMKEFTLEVIGEKFAITTTALADGTVDSYYNYKLSANLSNDVTWNCTLPSGLGDMKLDPNTGALYGTPSQPGVFGLYVTAKRGKETDEAWFTLTINSKPAEDDDTFRITKDYLPDGTYQLNYNQQIEATQTNGVVWRHTNGMMPTGLSINPSTGVISGLPSSIGTYTFEITAIKGSEKVSQWFTITINAQTSTGNIRIQDPGVLRGKINTMLEHTFKLTEQVADRVIWSISGGYPSGSHINSTSGYFNCQTSIADTYEFWVTASYGGKTDTLPVTCIISGNGYGEDDDDDGCNTGASIYALTLVAGLFGLKRKH
mgnify:CR=1 FL=1